jgi:hypothetical protein
MSSKRLFMSDRKSSNLLFCGQEATQMVPTRVNMMGSDMDRKFWIAPFMLLQS